MSQYIDCSVCGVFRVPSGQTPVCEGCAATCEDGDCEVCSDCVWRVGSGYKAAAALAQLMTPGVARDAVLYILTTNPPDGALEALPEHVAFRVCTCHGKGGAVTYSVPAAVEYVLEAARDWGGSLDFAALTHELYS